MDDAVKKAVGTALGRIPSGLYILTAQHEDRRLGILAGWVQQVCFDPPMVSVAVAKGKPIMPLISESRQFGLCQIGEADKVLLRKFTNLESSDDPFLGFELLHGKLPRVPILATSLSYLECELSCHMDVEGDHDLFVGLVQGGGGKEGTPKVHIREDGFSY